jgi:hypothetical protein
VQTGLRLVDGYAEHILCLANKLELIAWLVLRTYLADGLEPKYSDQAIPWLVLRTCSLLLDSRFCAFVILKDSEAAYFDRKQR